MKPIAQVALVVFTLVGAQANVLADGRTSSSPGGAPNAKPHRQAECISADRLNNKLTPLDLYLAVPKCARQGRYHEGATMFLLAGTYGHFDALRVVDRSAHEVIPVLEMHATLGLAGEHRQRLTDSIAAATRTTEGVAASCKEIMRIGPPDYHPGYMIEHGAASFIKTAGHPGLVRDFDAAGAWRQVLVKYLHCPNAQ